MWQLPLTKFNVGCCKKLDVNATMDMIVQSFPGLTELGLAVLEMEALPEGVIPKCVLPEEARCCSLTVRRSCRYRSAQ